MMGTDSLSWDPMAKDRDNISETITGGENRK